MYNYFKIHPLINKYFKGFSIFSSGGHLVQRSATVGAIMVEGHRRNLPVKLYQNPSCRFGGESFKAKGWQGTDEGQGTKTVTIAHYEHFMLM